MPEPSLLLTGFGPFPGVSENPTEALADALDGERVLGFPVIGACLTVCFESIEEQVVGLLERHRPRGVLLLGVAVKREVIGLEGQAYNLREADRPDAMGAIFPTPQALLPGEPLDQALPTHLDREGLLQALLNQGLPAELSEDPGRYLCNASFFHALHHSRTQPWSPPALFAHLPQLGNPIDKSSDKTWTISDLDSATRLLLGGIASQVSRQQHPRWNS